VLLNFCVCDAMLLINFNSLGWSLEDGKDFLNRLAASKKLETIAVSQGSPGACHFVHNC